MKLLMENWKKYLKQAKKMEDPSYKPPEEEKKERAKLDTFGLYYEQSIVGFTITLCDFNEEKGTPFVIGMVETMKPHESGGPCIPITHEIGMSAVDPKYGRRGIGTYLYEVAPLLVDEMAEKQGKQAQSPGQPKGGITSDHSTSTTTVAAGVWDKLEKFYVKRKTPKGPPEEVDKETGEVVGGYEGGRDEFDYNKSTEDPNDDCSNVQSGKAAVDHSLGIPSSRKAEIKGLMKVQEKIYSDYKNRFSKGYQRDLDAKLMIQADALFNKTYKPHLTGIHGETK